MFDFVLLAHFRMSAAGGFPSAAVKALALCVQAFLTTKTQAKKSANCRRTEYIHHSPLFPTAVSRTPQEQQYSVWFQAVLCKSFKEDSVNIL